jgi:formylglycine-generating enzyme required for sulfatase activity
MASIFISYRREDSAPYAGRLYDRLHAHFGAKHEVFMDIDTLQPGEDFVETIERIVSSCDVLIAVIGRQWLNAVDEEGRNRLENLEDFVRLEIQTALDRRIRVIPVLVGGARMPKAQELPTELALLTRRHYVEIIDTIFNPSVRKLIEGMENALSAPVPPSATPIAAPEPLRPPLSEPGATRVNPKDGLTYVWIPPGKFIMGCSPGDDECFDDEKRAHDVIITRGFWIGQTPVTQEAYERIMGKNPSKFKGTKLPVDSVTWTEGDAYCRAVGGRLPTEAEWEYAARAGSAAKRYGDIDNIAWYDNNSGGKTHDLGQKQANGFGLYDMLGNVWEWVADWYAPYPSGSVTDPRGPASGQSRVLRGGSWSNYSRNARVSYRFYVEPENRNYNFGFRCAED